IVTGIGHDKDETIACFVSDLNCSTPTGAGSEAVRDVNEVIQNNRRVLDYQASLLKSKLELHKEKVKSISHNQSNLLLFKVKEFKQELNNLNTQLSTRVKDLCSRMHTILQHQKIDIKNGLQTKLINIKIKLDNLKNLIGAHDVNYNLKKGYSILLKDNKSINSITNVSIGDELIGKVFDGNIKLEVKGKEKED